MKDIYSIVVKNSKWTSSSDLFIITYTKESHKRKQKLYRSNLSTELKEFFNQLCYIGIDADGNQLYMTYENAYKANLGGVKEMTYYKTPRGTIIARCYPTDNGYFLEIGKRFDSIDVISRLHHFFTEECYKLSTEKELKRELANLTKYHGDLTEEKAYYK